MFITYSSQYGPQFWFQISVSLFSFLISFYLFIKWTGKRNKIRFYLMATMLFYSLSLVASAVKVYYSYVLGSYPISSEYVLFLIREFRLSNSLTFIGNIFFYNFYLEVFSEIKKRTKKDLIYTIVSIVLAIIPMISFTHEYDRLILGSLLLIQSLIIYFPVTFKSFNVYKRLDNQFRWAFFFLFGMALTFLIMWLAYIANQLWDLLGGAYYGPFYYVIWISALITGLFAIAFIMPPFLRKILKISEDNA